MNINNLNINNFKSVKLEILASMLRLIFSWLSLIDILDKCFSSYFNSEY